MRSEQKIDKQSGRKRVEMALREIIRAGALGCVRQDGKPVAIISLDEPEHYLPFRRASLQEAETAGTLKKIVENAVHGGVPWRIEMWKGVPLYVTQHPEFSDPYRRGVSYREPAPCDCNALRAENKTLKARVAALERSTRPANDPETVAINRRRNPPRARPDFYYAF